VVHQPHMSTNSLTSLSSRFVAMTVGRGMTLPSYIALTLGLVGLVILTFDPKYELAHHWVEILLWLCQAFFALEWIVRLRHAARTDSLREYLLSARGVIDAVAALAAPIAVMTGAHPRSAWLLAVLWTLKPVPEIAGLRQLRRIFANEAGPLASVFLLFLILVFIASAAIHVLERDMQPEAFGTFPSALWWAVVTMTTVGYGDVVPITPGGRLLASFVMICGLGVFGLWTGILATGFAAETRRANFIKTWETVSKVPFFSQLGPAAIADVTHMLRTIELPSRTMVMRRGQVGDCMYFIASGEVAVELTGRQIRLTDGAFFGEFALLGSPIRTATITTTTPCTLLVLDLVDFRMLMAKHPDLGQTIDAEAKRRAAENAAAQQQVTMP
jgi:voltage-gated potassium channel